MNKFIYSIVFFILICTVANAFSLNIDPPSAWIKINAGESKSGTIILENKGDDSLYVKSYAQDWVYAKDRSKEFKAPGSAANSCSQWISIYPDNFIIGGRESKSIKYTITAPPSATGGYYSVIFFESTIKDEQSSKNSNIIIAGRIGTIIYLETQKGTIKAGSIEGYSIVPAKKNAPITALFNFKNQGNALISPVGTIIITDDDANLFGKFNVRKFNVLPNENIPIKTPLDVKLNPGKYSVVLTLDFDGSEPVSLENRFVVSK